MAYSQTGGWGRGRQDKMSKCLMSAHFLRETSLILLLTSIPFNIMSSNLIYDMNKFWIIQKETLHEIITIMAHLEIMTGIFCQYTYLEKGRIGRQFETENTGFLSKWEDDGSKKKRTLLKNSLSCSSCELASVPRIGNGKKKRKYEPWRWEEFPIDVQHGCTNVKCLCSCGKTNKSTPSARRISWFLSGLGELQPLLLSLTKSVRLLRKTSLANIIYSIVFDNKKNLLLSREYLKLSIFEGICLWSPW